MRDIQVDAASFHRWYDNIVDGGRVSVEYHADIGEIIVIAPPSELHQGVESVMSGWLDQVGAELSTPGNTFSSTRQTGKFGQ